MVEQWNGWEQAQLSVEDTDFSMRMERKEILANNVAEKTIKMTIGERLVS